MSMKLIDRRLKALEAGTPASAEPIDPRAAISPNPALALAEQIEAGRIDGLPPEVAAQPEKAAAIARRVAHFLSIV
ncbi:MAG: hypothetical protein RL654_641 [Pseudomonadota bacterium]|jgi:hypothetical protein